MENSYTVHNTFDLVADPVHFPITIGSEHFLVTQQDRRSIWDRRTWQLVRIFPTTLDSALQQVPCLLNQVPLQKVIEQLLALLTVFPNPTTTIDRPIPEATPPFKFHYEKQTSTDDLMIGPAEAPVVRHVHFVVDRGHWDKGCNTEQDWRIVKQTNQPMECDPGEGTSGMQSTFNDGNAYDLMKQRKEQQVFFW